MGDIGEHDNLEPFDVKSEPAEVFQPGKVNRFKHNFLVKPSMQRVLMMLHVTHTEA